jgi:acetyltransferase-like isoleucine patch superfamily enzyme
MMFLHRLWGDLVPKRTVHKNIVMLKRIISKIYGIIKPAPTSVPSLKNPLFTSQNDQFNLYEIGEWTYGGSDVQTWSEGATLKIGKFCSIAPKVTIMLVNDHKTDCVTTYPFDALFNYLDGGEFAGQAYTKGDVILGNDVWIGWNALILSGVRIGNGVIIAAHAVVTKDVEPYTVVAGNPARYIKHRYSIDHIEALQRIAWWDWPLSKIKDAWPLMSSDIEAFILEYDVMDATQAAF